nr:transformation system protein [uncultured Campylobacter sp.]
MLETYEVLELERRWRAYDKKRKEFKFKDKKTYIYAVSAVLAISVSVSSLTFYLLKDSLVSGVASSAISNEIKEPSKNSKHSEINEQKRNLDPSDNTLLNSDNFGINENLPEKQNSNVSISGDIDPQEEQHGWVNVNDLPSSTDSIASFSAARNIGGKQVAIKTPTEEKINFDSDGSFSSKSTSNGQGINKFQIQSSTSEVSVDELKAKFDKANSSDIAVLIAKRYYSTKDYQNSEKWALIANELDSNNEESWIIFAKSKYNLKQKNDAISVLKIYNDKANSANIEDLMKKIEDDTAL